MQLLLFAIIIIICNNYLQLYFIHKSDTQAGLWCSKIHHCMTCLKSDLVLSKIAETNVAKVGKEKQAPILSMCEVLMKGIIRIFLIENMRNI